MCNQRDVDFLTVNAACKHKDKEDLHSRPKILLLNVIAQHVFSLPDCIIITCIKSVMKTIYKNSKQKFF